MTTYTPGFELLLNNSYFEAVNASYTTSMGPWWIILLVLFSIVMSYIATRSEGIAAIVGLSGVVFLTIKYEYLPITAQPIIYAISAVCLGVLLFKAFFKE